MEFFNLDSDMIFSILEGVYSDYPMMNPKSYTGDVICRPSQFLEDFPAELVEERNVGSEDAWSDDEPF